MVPVLVEDLFVHPCLLVQKAHTQRSCQSGQHPCISKPIRLISPQCRLVAFSLPPRRSGCCPAKTSSRLCLRGHSCLWLAMGFIRNSASLLEVDFFTPKHAAGSPGPGKHQCAGLLGGSQSLWEDSLACLTRPLWLFDGQERRSIGAKTDVAAAHLAPIRLRCRVQTTMATEKQLHRSFSHLISCFPFACFLSLVYPAMFLIFGAS